MDENDITMDSSDGFFSEDDEFGATTQESDDDSVFETEIEALAASGVTSSAADFSSVLASRFQM